MKKIGLVCLMALGCLMVGCDMRFGDDESADSIVKGGSALDAVNAKLAEKGLCEGRSEDYVISVASYDIELKDPKELNEALRQVAYRKALVEAVCMIAEYGNERDINKEDDMGGVTMFFKLPLCGLAVLFSGESYDPATCVYQVAVAVQWTKKCASRSKAIALGEAIDAELAPGSKSIVEWVEENSASLGPRVFVDNAGDCWLIGSVFVDAAMRRYVERWFDGGGVASVEHKLRAYALDGISKLISIDVEFYTELKYLGENLSADKRREFVKHYDQEVFGMPDETGAYRRYEDDGGDTSMEVLKSTMRNGDEFRLADLNSSALFQKRIVRVNFHINPENPRLKWFTRKVINPISKKEIEVLIGTIRCNDIAVGERERQLKRISGN